MNLKINPDLKALIPPLTSAEYSLLEESLINEGCRDKIITWNDTIVDGHNRYEICTKNGIPFQVEDRDFEDIIEVRIWMRKNALGNRNLTPAWKIELELANKEDLKKKGKKNMSAGGGDRKSGLSQNDKPDINKHDTRKEIAKSAGTSTGQVGMAEQVKKKSPELWEKAKAGDIGISTAYNTIRKEEKKQEKREKYKEKKQQFDKETDQVIADAFCFNGSCLDYIKDFDKQIDLVLTDPPYAMDYKSGWNDWDKIEGDKRDDTVNILDDCFRLLKGKMKKDAHIYVFGNPNEVEFIKPIFEKYFALKNILIWDRQVIGMGDLKTYGRSYDIVYFGYNEGWKDLSGTRDRDVLEFKRVNPAELIHPTEKPIDLLKYLIKKSTDENDVVFDPFAGSCSTIRAGFELNRNSYGSELEIKYIPEWMLKST